MTKLPVAAGLALALAAGSALAADLPSRKGPPEYLPPPPPPFSWNGLYGGVNIGYGFGNGDLETGSQLYRNGTVGIGTFQFGGPSWANQVDLNGVTGGGQVGYNYQFSPWLVVGVEADIQAADIRSQRSSLSGFPAAGGFTPYLGAANAAHFVDWWGTVRGRLGFVLPSWPNLMVYGTGGFAYAGVNSTFSYASIVDPAFGGAGTVPGIAVGQAVYDDTKTGWTAGGGVEWSPMSFPAWSLKVEYLYTDLGSNTLGAIGVGFPAGHTNASVNNNAYRWHTVRAGLNWHFNPFGSSAPVLAKY